MFSKRPSAAILLAFSMALQAFGKPVPQYYYDECTTTDAAPFVPTLPAIFDVTTPVSAPVIEVTPTPSISLPIIEDVSTSFETAPTLFVETPAPSIPDTLVVWPSITSSPAVNIVQTPTSTPIIEKIQAPIPTPEYLEIYPRISVPTDVAVEAPCSTTVAVPIVAVPSSSAPQIGDVYAPVLSSFELIATPISVPNDNYLITTLTSTIVAIEARPSAAISTPVSVAVLTPSVPVYAPIVSAVPASPVPAPNTASTNLSMPAITASSSPAPLLATSASASATSDLFIVSTLPAIRPGVSSGLAFVPGTSAAPVITGIQRASSVAPAPVEFTGAARTLGADIEMGVFGGLFAVVLAML